MQANIEPMLEVEGSRLNLPGKIAAILSTVFPSAYPFSSLRRAGMLPFLVYGWRPCTPELPHLQKAADSLQNLYAIQT